jgi:hypothetical protein
VAFLAVLDEVREEVVRGSALTAIYDRHQEKLACITYSQFTVYVRRHIGSLRRKDAGEHREERKQSANRGPTTPSEFQEFKHDPHGAKTKKLV